LWVHRGKEVRALRLHFGIWWSGGEMAGGLYKASCKTSGDFHVKFWTMIKLERRERGNPRTWGWVRLQIQHAAKGKGVRSLPRKYGKPSRQTNPHSRLNHRRERRRRKGGPLVGGNTARKIWCRKGKLINVVIRTLPTYQTGRKGNSLREKGTWKRDREEKSIERPQIAPLELLGALKDPGRGSY